MTLKAPPSLPMVGRQRASNSSWGSLVNETKDVGSPQASLRALTALASAHPVAHRVGTEGTGREGPTLASPGTASLIVTAVTPQ